MISIFLYSNFEFVSVILRIDFFWLLVKRELANIMVLEAFLMYAYIRIIHFKVLSLYEIKKDSQFHGTLA